MSYPTPPDKVTAFNSARPATSSEIGLQFVEHTRAIKDVIAFLRQIVRDDGGLKNGIVSPEALDPQLSQMIAQTAMRAVEDMLAEVNAAIASVRTSAYEAGRAAERAERAATGINAALAEATRIKSETQAVAAQAQLDGVSGVSVSGVGVSGGGVRTLAAPLATIATGDPNDGVAPSSFLNQMSLLDGTTAGAQDWAEASLDWAEHMPDTIPGKTLGIMAVTGDHWSSRWWANRAAGLFGGSVAWLYLGAFPVPPATDVNGYPIQIGALWYDTTTNQMMVWDGVSWNPVTTPQPCATSTLYYTASANQTVFPLTVADIYGRTFTLDANGDEGVMTWLNGVRLVFDDGTGKGDFTVDPATSTVTLLKPAQAGMPVIVDVLVPPSKLAPGVALVKKIMTITPNGTQTSFVMICTDATAPDVKASTELFVCVDGVDQEPGVSFTASGNLITFASPPSADSYVWIVWLLSGGATS